MSDRSMELAGNPLAFDLFSYPLKACAPLLKVEIRIREGGYCPIEA